MRLSQRPWGLVLRQAVAACAVWALGIPLSAHAKRSDARSTSESDLSTHVASRVLPNGGMVWSLHKAANVATVALVVRAGAWQQDITQNGVALLTARWVLAALDQDQALWAGVTTQLEMLPGGAMFVLTGPQPALEAQLKKLLAVMLHPLPGNPRVLQEQAALESRQGALVDLWRETALGACWPSGSLDLPTWGGPWVRTLETGAAHKFQRAWYRTPRMTALVYGAPPDAFARMLAAASPQRMARARIPPGPTSLPNHVQGSGPRAFTLAGVAVGGPGSLGAALLLRARLEELLEAPGGSSPFTSTPVVGWTAVSSGMSLVHMAVLGAPSQGPSPGAVQVKHLETLFGEALHPSEDDLTRLRRAQGATLARAFSDPHSALAWLGPLATVMDAPPDLAQAVMGTPPEVFGAALAQAQSPEARFSAVMLQEQP